MTRSAWFIGVGALALAACGGGGESDPDAGTPIFIDASTTVDAGTQLECNALSQTGCQPGEKCAFILDDPDTGIGHTGCIGDGTVAIGGDCMGAAAAGEADDCASGGHCYLGKCHEICAIDGGGCAAGGCIGFDNLDFDVCLPDCDPLMQNCAEEPIIQGCYLTSTGAVCAAVVDPDGPQSEGNTGNTAGEPCEFLNNCARFHGCFDDGMGGGRCLRYCGPIDMCFDMDGNPTMCACGTSSTGTPGTEAQCGVAELCGGITGEDVVGVCVAATEFGCDCASTPICPPAM